MLLNYNKRCWNLAFQREQGVQLIELVAKVEPTSYSQVPEASAASSMHSQEIPISHPLTVADVP